MKGHLEIVTYLCQHGASVSATTDDGATPLHWASVRGNYDCVRYLLEHTNSNPQSVTKAGFTALHYACIVGNIHIARLLIYEYGVSVDCINEVLFKFFISIHFYLPLLYLILLYLILF